MQANIEYEDLGEKVYRSIKDLILAGEILPGEKLRQEELAERLGVSRTPLAAAFSKLEKEMLVELLPRRGARVRSLSDRELLELYEIRLRLEPLGAREAAAVVDRDAPPETEAGGARERLDRSLAAYREAVGAGQDMGIRRADYAFHITIMELSGNEPLLRIISSSNIVFISNQRGLLKPPSQSLAEHEGLVRAIGEGDGVRAESLMAEHLAGARARLVAIMGVSAR